MSAARQLQPAFDSHHLDVLDMVTELVDAHEHRERYEYETGGTRWARGHVTKVPPLLDQLQTATPSSAGDQAPAAGGFESQPAAHLESMDTLLLVDREASRWIRSHGLDDYGLTTVECVRRAASLLPRLDVRERGRLEHDVRRWWAQARIVAGWDSPAWRPDATCPACSVRGGLRVRLSSKAGLCVECRETWDPGTIGLLAEHIRIETMAEFVATRRPGPCAVVKGYEPEGLSFLCPACGRARCRRAVRLALDAVAREPALDAEPSPGSVRS